MTYTVRSITDWCRAMAPRPVAPSANERMYLASASFVAEYDGKEVEVTRGSSRLAPDHELVARFPERFTQIRITTGQPAVRNVTQAGRTDMLMPASGTTQRVTPLLTPLAPEHGGPVAARRDSGTELPEVVDPTGQGFHVTFWKSARRELWDEALRARDGLETGGWLLGTRIRSWEPTIAIEKVINAGPGSMRYARSMTIDVGEWCRSWEGGHLEIVGFWHSHPDSIEHGLSTTDLASGVKDLLAAEERGGSYFVELLAEVDAVPPGGRWRAPELAAWIMRREPTFGRVVCERATVDAI